MVKFRIIQFDTPMPITGHKFFIEWQVKKKKKKKGEVKKYKWGIFPYKTKEEKLVTVLVWENYIDPTKQTQAQGYITIQEAKFAIDIYKKTMTPIIHEIE